VIVVALLRAAAFFWASMVAATRMHDSMVVRVLRAPLAFFHTNPAGRVLNRFSNDLVRVVLCCAVLCCAVLCCAVLCCAVLCCAVLCCAVLCCAVLCCVLCCAACCAVLCCVLCCVLCAVLCCAMLCATLIASALWLITTTRRTQCSATTLNTTQHNTHTPTGPSGRHAAAVPL
jgi:hypothetical protein